MMPPAPAPLDYVTEIAAEFHAAWGRHAYRFGVPGLKVPLPAMPTSYQRCLRETVDELVRRGIIVPNPFQ